MNTESAIIKSKRCLRNKALGMSDISSLSAGFAVTGIFFMVMEKEFYDTYIYAVYKAYNALQLLINKIKNLLSGKYVLSGIIFDT